MRRDMIRLGCLVVLAQFVTGLSANAESKRDGNDLLDLQVRLARMNASPGPIDGKSGKNLRFAVKAYQRMRGLAQTGNIDGELRDALAEAGSEPTLNEYVINQKDVAGPFLAKMPVGLNEMAPLKHLGYTGPLEALAEKFHMSEELLRSLNPGAKFNPGDNIKVVNLGHAALPSSVKRIEVDKKDEVVWVYGADDRIIAAYPASIGSAETPSPEGRHKVVSVAKNPNYEYDPAKLHFKGVKADKKIVIAPGPNNPVGLVWIALDAPSYGIHGSAQPSKIRRQVSHGCVRLTNWDALQLASGVKKGVPVEFVQNAASPTVGEARENESQTKRKARRR